MPPWPRCSLMQWTLPSPQSEAAMEQCASVEREVDKVLQKFLTYGQHCEQSLEELLHHVGQLRAELASAGGCPPTRAPHLPPCGLGDPEATW